MSNGMVNTFTTMGNSQGSNSYRNVNTFYSSGNISITNNFIQSSINRLTSPSVNVNSFYGSNNVGATQNYSPIVNTFTSTTPNITTQTFTTPMQDRVSTTQDRVSTTENRTTQMENVSNTQTGIMTGGVMGSRSTTATSIASYSSSTPVILSDGNTSVQLITNPNPTISINGLSRYLV